MIDPEDLAAFHAAVADAKPLPRANRVFKQSAPPPPKPLKHLADEHAALHESLHAPLALQDWLEGGDEANYLHPGIATSVLRDLKRGRWVIQDSIDLHGLNREEARGLLAHFLIDCMKHGTRCVRIVHGKGLRSPGRQSVLRQLVRGWLMQRREILAFCQAPPRDGGDGALWVLLRSLK